MHINWRVFCNRINDISIHWFKGCTLWHSKFWNARLSFLNFRIIYFVSTYRFSDNTIPSLICHANEVNSLTVISRFCKLISDEFLKSWKTLIRLSETSVLSAMCAQEEKERKKGEIWYAKLRDSEKPHGNLKFSFLFWRSAHFFTTLAEKSFHRQSDTSSVISLLETYLRISPISQYSITICGVNLLTI